MFCLLCLAVFFYVEIEHIFNILFHICSEQIWCLLRLLVFATGEMEIMNLEDLDFFYNLL